MSNLLQRVLTAAFGVPVLLFLFHRGGAWFLAFILIVALACHLELSNLFKSARVSAEARAGLVASLVLPVAAYFGYIPLLAGFTLAAAAILSLQLRRRDFSSAVAEPAAALLGVVYIGLFLSHAVLIRNIGAAQAQSDALGGMRDAGFFYIVFAVACTFLNDAGAYFAGKWKGRRKLIPAISPGKTLEGAVGGLAASALTGAVVNLIFASPLPYAWALFLGVAVGGVAVVGDLIESLIKRSVGAKDSGALLPGHGGALDRFDSLILVFPVFYYLILFYYRLKGVLLL
ncbi:MAG: phosphatidate cytidylyltransferase [Deltaproteobacteria bacterium]